MIPTAFLITMVLLFIGLRIRLPMGAYLGALWLICAWLTTLIHHSLTGYVASDEIFFATEEISGLFSNRILWIALNQLNGFFTDNIIEHMRVLNLGFLLVIYIVAVQTLKTFPPFPLAIAMSYFGCVAALNLRDIAILLGTLLFLRAQANFGSGFKDQVRLLIKARLAIVFLILLRPFQFVLLTIAGLRMHFLILAIIALVIVLQTPFATQNFYNAAYYSQNFSEAIKAKAEDKDQARLEPSLENIAFWMARFVFAPDPISVTHRFLFQPETYPYGQVDLGFRVLNRFVLYGLMTTILYHLIRRPRFIIRELRRCSFAIKFAILLSLIYALFNFGGSHERIKLNLLLVLLFILDRLNSALVTVREKRRNRMPESAVGSSSQISLHQH